MEAPEKIYLVNDDLNIKREWYKTKQVGFETTEYTRTDAFIDEAENYLNSQLYDWVNITNPDQRSCANIIPKKDFIEDFRNYMKKDKV